MIGFSMAGLSMLATVVADWLLTKPSARKGASNLAWRLVSLCSLALIVVGGWLTLGSMRSIRWFDVSLIGELMAIGGYYLWIVMKTYAGEGNRTVLSRILKKIVLID
jgi:hypothetical protein